MNVIKLFTSQENKDKVFLGNSSGSLNASDVLWIYEENRFNFIVPNFNVYEMMYINEIHSAAFSI